jgi:hypothetical protein
MQMGIEAALKAHFGEALQQVVQVDKLDIGATLEVSATKWRWTKSCLAPFFG